MLQQPEAGPVELGLEDDGADAVGCLDELDDGREAWEAPDPELVAKTNEESRKAFEADSQPYQVQNLTVVEPMESRATKEILRVLDLIYVKYRSMGIPLFRFHTDRAKELVSSKVHTWMAAKGMKQTMSSGDDPASALESEIGQIKRRMRLLLASTKSPSSLWPSALRYAGVERLRAQLQRAGIPIPSMPPFQARVMAKVKRWHKQGGLNSPFKEVRLLGPSPLIPTGWIVRDAQGLVQHARVVLVPDPSSVQVEHELEIMDPSGIPTKRVTGKQALFPRPDLRHAEELHPGEVGDALGSAEDAPREGPPAAVIADGGESLSDGVLPGVLPGHDEVLRVEALRHEPAWERGQLEVSEQRWTERLRGYHWSLKQVLEEELRAVATTEEEGVLQGLLMEAIQGRVEMLEMILEEHCKEEADRTRSLCVMQAAESAGPEMDQPAADEEQVRVLQTYTVPIAKVRTELADWLPGIREEYLAVDGEDGCGHQATSG